MNTQENFCEVQAALQPKVVLITGAARRLGAVIARLLHHHGMNVLLHYHQSESEVKTLCSELNSLRTDSALALQADLLQNKQLISLVHKASKVWGHLDVLVHNASMFYATPVSSANEAAWDELMGTNLKAAFFLAQAAAPHLAKRHGCIVNIADIHGLKPLREHPIYCAAKAGLIMLSKSLAIELAPEIRVNVVAPGSITWHGHEQELDAALQAKIIKRTPLQRLGNAMESAQAVLFFIEQADYSTGQVLTVDGGRGI
ncbi:pteridine reductase [soil metagenome]